jgi:hypothetical protein
MARIRGCVLMTCEECGQSFCVDRLAIPAVRVWYVHSCTDGWQWKITEADVILEVLIRRTRTQLERLLQRKRTRRSINKRSSDAKQLSVTHDAALSDTPTD